MFISLECTNEMDRTGLECYLSPLPSISCSDLQPIQSGEDGEEINNRKHKDLNDTIVLPNPLVI